MLLRIVVISLLPATIVLLSVDVDLTVLVDL